MSASRRNPRRGARGFTLVEVLVAFVILISMAGTLMRFISGGVEQTGRGRDEAALAMVAEGVLAGIGSAVPYGAGEREIEVGEGYLGTVRMEPVTQDLRGAQMPFRAWAVTVTVWADTDGRRTAEEAGGHALTLATVALDPLAF